MTDKQSILKDRIKALAEEYAKDLVAIRRHLHANPELSFEEFKTASFVAEQLRSYGLQPKEGIAETGLTVVIEGKDASSKTIALRADMDALPIEESNDVPYKSQNKGVMHACGHDVHTTSLLGTARILQHLKSDFTGSIKLLFQPGEEKIPGGASLMIEAGVLQNPSPSHIMGQHVMPLIDVGQVGFREGMYMASADEIYLTVKGKGGHAAAPETLVDPVVIAAQIIMGLQQIVSRNANPKIPSVLSFGNIIGKGATNVIPDEVKIDGTFRTLNEKWRSEAKQRIKQMAQSIAEGMGGSCEVTILDGFPYLENQPELTSRARSSAESYLGPENVLDLDLWMASEDFAFYSQHLDACFYRLGVRNEAKGITSMVHTPTFDIDEKALEIGAGLMTWLAIEELAYAG
ncbi:MAG: M20 metallopeptidase family protein [Cyclobacteriaceae bacterium]